MEKEFLTITELAEFVGIKRASLYYYINALDIKTHKFNFDKKAYIALADAKRIKELKEKPWTAGEKTQKSKEETAA